MEKRSMPFGQWIPDRPRTGGDHVVVASGVIPETSGFRPFLGGIPQGEPLPSGCRGAFMAWGHKEKVYTVAGTSTGLYVRDNTDSWVQKGSGFSLNEGSWSFCQYGDIVVAANGYDPVQYSTIDDNGMANFQPIPNAPIGSRVGIIGDFLFIGDLSDRRNAVRWSGIDDPLYWPTPGSNDAQYALSDIQVFPEGGNVQAIVSGMSGYEGLVFCERAIYRFQFTGGEAIFQITAVDKSIGALARDSVIHFNNVVYWFGQNGFYGTDGSTVTNIGQEIISQWWEKTANSGRRQEVVATVDPMNNLVVFAFPDNFAKSRRFNHLLLYHPKLNAFSTVPVELEWVYADCSRGLTLEDLDVYGPLDTLPFSLDAKNLIKDVQVLAGFNPEHRPVLFTGSPVEAIIETVEMGGEQTMIHGVRPAVDLADPQVKTKARRYFKETPKIKKCSPASRLDGICRTRTFGRFISFELTVPAGVRWTHAMGLDVYYENGGWQ